MMSLLSRLRSLLGSPNCLPEVSSASFERIVPEMSSIQTKLKPESHVECFCSGLDFQLLTALHYGNAKALSRLIQSGSNVNFLCHGGPTPLHIAIEQGFLDCVEVLLENNADPNLSCRRVYYVKGVRDSDLEWEWTPLECAAIYDQPECIELLLAYGADVNHKDSYGKCALSVAYEYVRPRCIAILQRYTDEAICK